jgi:hypothetical protein
MAVVLTALAACEKGQVVSVLPEAALAEEDNEPWVLKNMIDLFQPGTGGPVALCADYGGTRAHIDMNDEETFAQWVWKAGDSFEMYAFAGTNYQYAKFTATGGGAVADFTAQYSINLDPPFYVIYPGLGKINLYNDHPLLGVNIPASQEAVPGGIKDGYTVAVATTQNLSDFVHFSPLSSLVRFRMSGALVPQVKTVTIKGTSPLAGDIVFLGNADGTVALTDDVWFTSDNRSVTATLSGDFVAGQDYYLVLKPTTQSRFQMIFADDTGQSTTMTANTFTFPQGRISDFGTIDLGSEFTDDNTVYEPIRYMTASAGAPKPVTIAVVPDGFTKEQLSSYVLLAQSGIDALMNTEPYKTYKDYFNVWILQKPSKEAGASVTDGNGNITEPVNNAFGSRWGPGYRDMAADSGDLFDFVCRNCPDIINGVHPISEVPILLIINDTRYGGICHSYSNGQGFGMVPYTYEGDPIHWSYPSVTPSTNEPISSSEMNNNYHRTTNEEYAAMGRNTGDWRNTLVHEFGGHCIGRLGDEYWSDGQLSYQSGPINTHNWTVPLALNVASSPTAVTWQADVLNYPLADLVANDPNYGRIGTFQGGGTVMFGRWRSEMISCMIDNRFYFSTWQRLLIVRRIMSLSGATFDAASFWANDVTFDPVRDVQSSPVMGGFELPHREVPLLPPPVLHEVLE